MKRETNNQFAVTDLLFAEACKLAEIPVTSRQASKWRRGLGLAIRFKQRAFAAVTQEKIREMFSKGIE